MQGTAETRGRGVGRLIPIVDWLPRYDRAMLRGDVLARALSGCGTFQPREETNGDDVSRDIVAGST